MLELKLCCWFWGKKTDLANHQQASGPFGVCSGVSNKITQHLFHPDSRWFNVKNKQGLTTETNPWGTCHDFLWGMLHLQTFRTKMLLYWGKKNNKTKKKDKGQSTLFICVSNVFFCLTFTDPKTQLNAVYFNLSVISQLSGAPGCLVNIIPG